MLLSLLKGKIRSSLRTPYSILLRSKNPVYDSGVTPKQNSGKTRETVTHLANRRRFSFFERMTGKKKVFFSIQLRLSTKTDTLRCHHQSQKAIFNILHICDTYVTYTEMFSFCHDLRVNWFLLFVINFLRITSSNLNSYPAFVFFTLSIPLSYTMNLLLEIHLSFLYLRFLQVTRTEIQ